MGLNNNYCSSDYGSGSSSSSWMSQQDIRWPSFQPKQTMERPNQKSSSYSDLVMGRCTLEDVMREFQMNGSDSPYNPDEDRTWGKQTAYSEMSLSGLGPSSAYVRQKSWPAPERSPAPRLLRPEPMEFATSTPVFDEAPAPFMPAPLVTPECLMPEQTRLMPEQTRLTPEQTRLTPEQIRVLNSLPVAVLHSLLKELHTEKRTKLFQECRFCKNNGERETYYRSHVLKDAAGRVACPVLRAFVCARCGARGDRAHTIKYCPLSTNEERIKSAAMMRSVRMASGRRRASGSLPAPSVRGAGELAPHDAPLDPLWAALEQKLML